MSEASLFGAVEASAVSIELSLWLGALTSYDQVLDGFEGLWFDFFKLFRGDFSPMDRLQKSPPVVPLVYSEQLKCAGLEKMPCPYGGKEKDVPYIFYQAVDPGAKISPGVCGVE